MCRLSEASETAVHGVRKWSGKTGLEIIITGPSADLGLHGPGLPGTGLRMEHNTALALRNLATPHWAADTATCSRSVAMPANEPVHSIYMMCSGATTDAIYLNIVHSLILLTPEGGLNKKRIWEQRITNKPHTPHSQ